MPGEEPPHATTDGLMLGRDPAGASVHLSWAELAGHGLICGVTGSGKTHTIKLIAESLSALGVPVLAVDAKSDFAGIAQARSDADAIFDPGELPPLRAPPPVVLWDLTGRRGHRLTLSRAPGAPPAVGLPPFGLRREDGVGYVSVLDSAALISTAAAYAGAVCDLIVHVAEIPSALIVPSAGLQMAILIEEAHLVFRHIDLGRRRALAKALERLTSRHIAVVFTAPDPCDPPELIDAGLGLRIQHSLWAPSHASQARLTAWFGADPEDKGWDACEAVRALGIGEALVARGRGSPAIRVQIARSSTRDGPLSAGERRSLVAATSVLVSPPAPSTSLRGRARQLRAGLRSHGRRHRDNRAPG